MVMPEIVENAYKKQHFEKHNSALEEIPIYELNKKTRGAQWATALADWLVKELKMKRNRVDESACTTDDPKETFFVGVYTDDVVQNGSPERKLWFKEKVTFPEEGMYKLRIMQAVRNNGDVDGVTKLEGITDVGFSIEEASQE